jgi:hypothetical protein
MLCQDWFCISTLTSVLGSRWISTLRRKGFPYNFDCLCFHATVKICIIYTQWSSIRWLGVNIASVRNNGGMTTNHIACFDVRMLDCVRVYPWIHPWIHRLQQDHPTHIQWSWGVEIYCHTSRCNLDHQHTSNRWQTEAELFQLTPNCEIVCSRRKP